jgi:integrase
MLTLGLRISEVSWLRWEDVDLEAGTLTVRRTRTRTAAGRVQERDDTKSDRSRRRLRLPARCVTLLKAWKVAQLQERMAAGPAWHDLDLVWPTSVGTPYDRGNLRRMLGRACERAGLRHANLHLLRHSCVSFMLAQGVSERVILDVLGHRSPRMIQRYQHVHDSLRDDAAAAMDDLLGGFAGEAT